MKDKIKLVIVFIIGITISVIINVSAATVIAASKVSYTSNSNTTVQAGLDNLYTKISNLQTNVNNIKTYTLLSSTTTQANSTKDSYSYQTVSNMNKYVAIIVRVTVGNQNWNLFFVNGDTTINSVHDYATTSYQIRGVFYCDWTNNRIYVSYASPVAGFNYTNVSINRVYGVIVK